MDIIKKFESINITQDQAIEFATTYGTKILLALVIFIIGKWIANIITSLSKKAMKKARTDEMLINFLGSILHSLLLVAVVIAALEQIGVETSSLVAVLAAAGLAIGLALQGSLSNLASGVMIILFKPFKKGDFVEAAGISGSINDISIFNTKLTTPDNKVIIVANSNITSNNITNYSANKTRRLDMVFGISYDDNIKKAKTIIEKTLKSEKRILPDPAPTIGVLELADSSVNIAVRPWVKTADYWPTCFDLQEQIKVEFDKAGITIPYPQRDVHVFNEKKK